MEQYLDVDNKVFNDDTLTIYYEQYELYRIYDDIFRESPSYHNYAMHSTFCWYVAQNMVVDIISYQYPTKMYNRSYDKLFLKDTWCNPILKIFIMFGVQLILFSNKLKVQGDDFTKYDEIIDKINDIENSLKWLRANYHDLRTAEELDQAIIGEGKSYDDLREYLKRNNDNANYLAKDEGAYSIVQEKSNPMNDLHLRLDVQNSFIKTLQGENQKLTKQINDLEKDKQKNEELNAIIEEKNKEIVELQQQIEKLNGLQEQEDNNEPDEATFYNKVRLKVLYTLVDKVGWQEEKRGAKIALAKLAQKITGISLKQCQEYIPDRNTDTTYHDQQLREVRSYLNSAEIAISI